MQRQRLKRLFSYSLFDFDAIRKRMNGWLIKKRYKCINDLSTKLVHASLHIILFTRTLSIYCWCSLIHKEAPKPYVVQYNSMHILHLLLLYAIESPFSRKTHLLNMREDLFKISYENPDLPWILECNLPNFE